MNIERMFKEDIKDKKRTGSNIFSRVSTRKGGTNRALKTPYLFMTAKERKRLNGEVRSFNMNEILNYSDFSELPKEEQKNLMTHWRKSFKTQDIQTQMGISRTVFYKVINNLEIPKEETNFKIEDKKTLSDEEMRLYKDKIIDYALFKRIIRVQQGELLEHYVREFGSISSVVKVWDNADGGYLYNVRSTLRNKDKKKRKTAPKVIPPTVKEEIDVKNKVVNTQNTKDELEIIDDKTPVNSTSGHNSNIVINSNSFNFELKGSYKAETIIKRLKLALDVIEDENELLELEISIKGGN